MRPAGLQPAASRVSAECNVGHTDLEIYDPIAPIKTCNETKLYVCSICGNLWLTNHGNISVTACKKAFGCFESG